MSRIVANPHYFNENDPYAAQWLRNLIAAKLIAHGDVDERSIVEVQPSDLVGYTQCHFFAGIGGWALAARLAGWPDDRELWTGSCPCQPFSAIGKGKGVEDERHLWPEYLRLIRACWPAAVVGEQVASPAGRDWIDGVLADLESIHYQGRAVIIPACAVDAPHRRERMYFVADGYGLVGDSQCEGLERHTRHVDTARGRAIESRSITSSSCSGDVGNPFGESQHCSVIRSGPQGSETAASARALDDQYAGSGIAGSAWDSAQWVIGHDGKARRVKPGIRLLADGFSARVGRLRAYGNAIVPQEAAEVIAAWMDCTP